MIPTQPKLSTIETLGLERIKNLQIENNQSVKVSLTADEKFIAFQPNYTPTKTLLEELKKNGAKFN